MRTSFAALLALSMTAGSISDAEAKGRGKLGGFGRSKPAPTVVQPSRWAVQKALNVIAPRGGKVTAALNGVAVLTGAAILALSVEDLRKHGAEEYNKLEASLLAQEALVPEGDPRLQKLIISTQKVIASAHTIHGEKLTPYDFRVMLVDDPTVNAMMYPGGQMVFYTGLTDKLTDDQLAAVIGHEIMHALEDHAHAKLQMIGAGLATWGVIGGITGRDMGKPMAIGALLSLGNSRSQEIAADLWGAQFLEMGKVAGANPCSAVEAQKILGESTSSQRPEVLSTHPNAQNRIRALLKEYPGCE